MKLSNILRITFCHFLASGHLVLTVVALTLGIGELVAADGPLSVNRPFSIQQQDQTSCLVRPNGERFFSLGVCCVNQGASREEWESANPGYAAWQHYADSNAWAKATLERLKAWGFTTVGG